jgi:hypothetical protein
MLQGWQSERQRLERELERAWRGESAVLLHPGEAGIGKTALVEDDAGSARSFRPCLCEGTRERERERALLGRAFLMRPAAAALPVTSRSRQTPLREQEAAFLATGARAQAAT